MAPREDARGLLGSVRLRAALALGLLVAPLGVNTMATWSSQARIQPGSVTAGHFSLQVNGSDGPLSAGLDMPSMETGSSTAALLTVTNTSNTDRLPLLYSVTATATDSGAAGTTSRLSAKVTLGSVTESDTSLTCSGAALAGSGNTFNGALVGGTPTTRRTLARGASETLCVQASLASGAPAGGSSHITLTFDAQQKAP